MAEADLIDRLWARRHELSEAEWAEASPILLGYAAAAKWERSLVPEDDRLRHIIDRDRYIVAACLGSIKRAIAGRDWLHPGGGRGAYEWDDDRFREEFAAAISEIELALKPLEIVAWDKADCTQISERVAVARDMARLILALPHRPRTMIAADLGLPCPACQGLRE